MEEDSRVLSELRGSSSRGSAGIISKIRLENFMCHSSLQIEFGDWVNFITGQNGSGKSAILTALCIAFGSRARATQRASSLKEFIKTGCSYAVVVIELKNQGEDAFKPDIYGDLIIIERRITETTSSTVLKDRQGKKVAHQKEELRELVEHFNIDVENPCVIMGQDKSREFLHSGNDKEKFKFFFRATLLQQVDELLENIRGQLDSANAIIDDLESSIRPILKELDDLQEKIKNLEHVEEISQKLQKLKKKLAWAWVYDVDKQIQEQAARVEKLKDRIPTCQARIDRELVKVENLKVTLLDKKAKIASMMERTSEVRKMKDELQQNLSQATREKLELEEELTQRTNHVKKLVKKVRWLEQQVHDIQEQHVRNTQAEVSEMELRLKSLEVELEDAYSTVQRLKEEENALHEEHLRLTDAIKDIGQEIEEYKSKHRDINGHIRSLQQQRTNKVTAFGGERVLNLLRSIERHHMKFRKPPIGPIGAHMALVKDDGWALAIEHAIGKLLNSFIVTDHKDSLLLRQCAREANYQDLKIIIYDYSRPLLNIPPHMLPNTNHPTIVSVIHADIPTIINVLVDQGDAERLVLVRDYEMGKNVAFEQRISNLKEVYTKEGYRMFSRGSVQTTLPPNKRIRSGRLCGSIDDQITVLENDASEAQRFARHGEGRKREVESALQDFHARLHSVKRRRLDAESYRLSKEMELRDLNSSYAAETSSDPAPDVDELLHEISTLQDQKQGKELLLEKFRARLIEAGEKATTFKQSFENLCVSAKGEIDALEEAERELLSIQEDLRSAETEKAHYEGVMQRKVLSDIKQAESEYEKLQLNRAESHRKASIICSESEVEALGGCAGSTPEHLSAKINGLNKRLQYESQRYPESIDDLRIMHERKKHKISRKQQTYEAFREKMNALQKSLDLRRKKFQRNAILLKRQLTWQFNGHLRKKGISGLIKVDYEKKTLSVEVKMPQDASSNSVRDTRGLSGGERSFSTLCFALALHEMTEAPFRAMDEFDVFMDAVSRKISLDTLVDFAVAQGSQWIFITPHDISMVKPTERVRKQQMAAPRS